MVMSFSSAYRRTISSLLPPGRSGVLLGCGRLEAARDEAEEGAGEGRPPWGGMKPPGSRDDSIMVVVMCLVNVD
ncbi:hypothetical protein MKX07_006539 [Trichoderma sp. CBMAI-0711]|nr:hypothetical protein MKX07_006539 [Trichoderma sp. CBMAI-0711]